jgi:hypothetical protein
MDWAGGVSSFHIPVSYIPYTNREKVPERIHRHRENIKKCVLFTICSRQKLKGNNNVVVSCFMYSSPLFLLLASKKTCNELEQYS